MNQLIEGGCSIRAVAAALATTQWQEAAAVFESQVHCVIKHQYQTSWLDCHLHLTSVANLTL